MIGILFYSFPIYSAKVFSLETITGITQFLCQFCGSTSAVLPTSWIDHPYEASRRLLQR